MSSIKIVKDNITKHFNRDDYFGFPSNGVVIPDVRPRLVMGAGAALTFSRFFSDLPFALGEHLYKNHKPVTTNSSIYHYKVLEVYFEGYNLFAFQTKLNWNSPSTGSLISDSARKLNEVMMDIENKESIFHMPTPGIGLGTISYETVMKIMNTEIEAPERLVLYKL